MYKKITTIILFLFTITGCINLQDSLVESLKKERVLDKAAWDFQCEKKRLVLKRLNDTSYGVTGCGKRASYILHYCHEKTFFTNVRVACIASLDSGLDKKLTKEELMNVFRNKQASTQKDTFSQGINAANQKNKAALNSKEDKTTTF